MAEQKDFLDYEGLTSYDHRIKEYIENAISQLKDEITDLPSQDVDDILNIIEDDEDGEG